MIKAIFNWLWLHREIKIIHLYGTGNETGRGQMTYNQYVRKYSPLTWIIFGFVCIVNIAVDAEKLDNDIDEFFLHTSGSIEIYEAGNKRTRLWRFKRLYSN